MFQKSPRGFIRDVNAELDGLSHYTDGPGHSVRRPGDPRIPRERCGSSSTLRSMGSDGCYSGRMSACVLFGLGQVDFFPGAQPGKCSGSLKVPDYRSSFQAPEEVLEVQGLLGVSVNSIEVYFCNFVVHCVGFAVRFFFVWLKKQPILSVLSSCNMVHKSGHSI